MRLNATLTARLISWRPLTRMCFMALLTPVLAQLSFQGHWLLSSYDLEVRGENTPERKFASTGCRTNNHQVTSQTRSPLSHPGGLNVRYKVFEPCFNKMEFNFFFTNDDTRGFSGLIRHILVLLHDYFFFFKY